MDARGDFPLSERERERRIPRLGKKEEGSECCETRSKEILEDFLDAGARKQFCQFCRASAAPTFCQASKPFARHANEKAAHLPNHKLPVVIQVLDRVVSEVEIPQVRAVLEGHQRRERGDVVGGEVWSGKDESHMDG